MTNDIGSIEIIFTGPNNAKESLKWYFKPNTNTMILQSKDVPLGATYPISELEKALIFTCKGVARIAVAVSEGKTGPNVFDVDKFTNEEWPLEEENN